MDQEMKKHVLIINNETSAIKDIKSSLNGSNAIKVSQWMNGESAYRVIRELKPDMLVVNLETPGLVSSWTAMQLDNVEMARNIPVVATSGILAWEEMEVLSDMTGTKILPDSIPGRQLGEIVKSTLLQ